MRKFLLFILFLVVVGSNYGCAATMAAKQPSAKDLSLLTPGTSRTAVLLEFGRPISSEQINGKKTEIYQFVDGYSTGAKTMRFLFHVTADIFTVFLWEIIGIPMEAGFDGDVLAYQVNFDEADKIATAELLKGEKPGTTTVAGDCDPGADSCT